MYPCALVDLPGGLLFEVNTFQGSRLEELIKPMMNAN